MNCLAPQSSPNWIFSLDITRYGSEMGMSIRLPFGLIYSPNVTTHVDHLETVFQLLQQHKLYANRKKCEFGKSQLAYLGHLISLEGVVVDPAKVQAMVEWPQPKTITELRGFLGLSGYYRKFVPGYRQIAGPLTDQLKKNCF